MSKKKQSGKTIRLAFLFIFLVIVLLAISTLVKTALLFKESKFDGSHKFNVVLASQYAYQIISFSPQGKSISILKLDKKIAVKDVSKTLDIPIDGEVVVSGPVAGNKLTSTLFKATTSFGSELKNLNTIDALKLFLFARGVSSTSIYERPLSSGLSDTQKSTVLLLTFTDPTIYQESQGIQIINATDEFGLGTKMANFISNMGGNVILVSTADKVSNESSISYYQTPTYTVKKLAQYLGFKLKQSDVKEVADVIIVIGKDSLGKINY